MIPLFPVFRKNMLMDFLLKILFCSKKDPRKWDAILFSQIFPTFVYTAGVMSLQIIISLG